MVTGYLLELSAAYRLTGQVEEAIATNKQVLMLDPNYQFAYSNLAFTYIFAWGWQLSQDPQVLEQALAAAKKALALNDSFPWAHTALGAVYLQQNQPEQALDRGQAGPHPRSHLPDGYGLLAAILNAVGKPEEALGAAKKAVDLGSSNPFYLFELGHAYCLSGRYEEAMSTLKQFISRAPNILHAQLFLALAASEAGREEEARAAAAEVLRINPKFSLEVHRQRATIRDPAVLERHIAALRKAGLK